MNMADVIFELKATTKKANSARPPSFSVATALTAVSTARTATLRLLPSIVRTGCLGSLLLKRVFEEPFFWESEGGFRYWIEFFESIGV